MEILLSFIVELVKGKTIRFVSNNLNTLELLQLCNKHITPLAPKDTVELATTTKTEKQKVRKQIKRK